MSVLTSATIINNGNEIVTMSNLIFAFISLIETSAKKTIAIIHVTDVNRLINENKGMLKNNSP